MKITYYEEIDLLTNRKNTIFTAKQGDQDSRELRVEFMAGGVKVVVNQTDTVTINVERPDGETDAFFGSVNTDGTVTVPFPNWALQVQGLARCSISVINAASETKFTTRAFYIDVERAEYTGTEVEENEEYDVLTALIAEVQETVIVSADIDENGNLILVREDGTEVEAGHAKGDKGDKGDTGAQGPQGEKGDKGDTGATGAQGPQGEKGDTGAQGEKGDKGDTGAQGEKGEKGDKGDPGETPDLSNYVQKNYYSDWNNSRAGLCYPVYKYGLSQSTNGGGLLLVSASEANIRAGKTQGETGFGAITTANVNLLPEALGLMDRPFIGTLSAAPTQDTEGIPGKFYRYVFGDGNIDEEHYVDTYLCLVKYERQGNTEYGWVKINSDFSIGQDHDSPRVLE